MLFWMEYRGHSENLAIATMLAAAAVLVMWLINFESLGGGFHPRQMPLLLLAAGIGAVLSGLFVAPWFGQGGVSGWLLAAAAAVVATGLAAVIGGLVFYALDLWLNPGDLSFPEAGFLRVVFVAGAFVFSAIGVPSIGVPWLLMMIAIQIVALFLRR